MDAGQQARRTQLPIRSSLESLHKLSGSSETRILAGEGRASASSPNPPIPARMALRTNQNVSPVAAREHPWTQRGSLVRGARGCME